MKDEEPSNKEINGVIGATEQIIRKAINSLEIEEPGTNTEPQTEKQDNTPNGKTKAETPVQKTKTNVPATVNKPQPPAKDWRQGRTNAEIAKEIEEAEKKRSKDNTKKALVGGTFYRPGGINEVPTVNKPQPPAKDWRQGRTNAEIAKEIEEAEKKRSKDNTKKALVGGTFYRPGGINEVPTAKAIQEIANEPGIKICSEIREDEQTDQYAHVKVRSFLGDQYVESVVHLDFENERKLKMIELIRKHPHILEGFENGVPIIKPDAMIDIGDKRVLAALHLYDLFLRYIKFSIRSATTTATTNNYKKLLNQDWRSKEEIQMEDDEINMVQDSIETEKAMRG